MCKCIIFNVQELSKYMLVCNLKAVSGLEKPNKCFALFVIQNCNCIHETCTMRSLAVFERVFSQKIVYIQTWTNRYVKSVSTEGGTEILQQRNKSSSNSARLSKVPVIFSGTKPFFNNDYKKSCKPSPLSGSAFYQKRFHCEDHSY